MISRGGDSASFYQFSICIVLSRCRSQLLIILPAICDFLQNHIAGEHVLLQLDGGWHILAGDFSIDLDDIVGVFSYLKLTLTRGRDFQLWKDRGVVTTSDGHISMLMNVSGRVGCHVLL